MSQFHFGAGVLYGRSLTNTPATPVRFGALQDVSIDFAFTTKELHGSYQFPLALGRGVGKVTGKANFAQFNAQAFNDLFFGLSNPATGETKTVVGEAATITANIVTAAHNTGVYVQDLGVVKASDGTVYTRVANSPVGQQYSCNETTGVYTFNNTQNAVAVLVSYQYTDAANGKIITITNQLLGNAPQFIGVFTSTFNGKQITLTLNACMSNKLTLATKLEDFTIPSFDFSAFADASNTIGTLSTDE
ncbi:MAG TPA: hypothetical protein VIY48_11955 [Candidatus Paceibacterota bacterium]